MGAADDEVNAALKAQIDKGTSYGAPCELEVSSALRSSGDCVFKQQIGQDTGIAGSVMLLCYLGHWPSVEMP